MATPIILWIFRKRKQSSNLSMASLLTNSQHLFEKWHQATAAPARDDLSVHFPQTNPQILGLICPFISRSKVKLTKSFISHSTWNFFIWMACEKRKIFIFTDFFTWQSHNWERIKIVTKRNKYQETGLDLSSSAKIFLVCVLNSFPLHVFLRIELFHQKEQIILGQFAECEYDSRCPWVLPPTHTVICLCVALPAL